MMTLDPKDTSRYPNRIQLTALLVLLSLLISFLPQVPAKAANIAKPGDRVEIVGSIDYRARKEPKANGETIGYWFPKESFLVREVVTGDYMTGYGNLWYRTTIYGNTCYVIVDQDPAYQKIVSASTPKPTPTPTPAPTPKPTPTPPPQENSDIPAGTPMYTQAEWQNLLKKFPASYRDSLEKLHKDHPSWSFEPYFHDFSLEYAVDVEKKVASRNLVPYYFTEYRDPAYPNPFDAGGWYAANKETLLFTMDPRNWLNEKYIFMFEKLSEVVNAPAERRLRKMYSHNPDLLNMIPDIISASRAHGVSPVFVGTRILTEVQTKDANGNYTITPNAKGTLKISWEDYKNLKLKVPYDRSYYNVFNVGAYHGESPQTNSIYYAMGYGTDDQEKKTYGLPWDSQYKAIYGGLTFIKEAYLDVGQNTNYYMKYNLRHSKGDLPNKVWHQYMGNAFAPATEGSVQYEANRDAGTLDEAFTFLIPVFQNMDNYAYTNPGNRYPDHVPSQQPGSSDNDYEIGPAKQFGNAGDRLRITYQYGYYVRAAAKTTSDEVGYLYQGDSALILARVTGENVSAGTNQWYKVRLDNGKTGYVNAYPYRQEILKKVVKPTPTPTPRPTPKPTPPPSGQKQRLGDLNGDGKISNSDLILIRYHLVGLRKLNAEEIKRADINKDGRITNADLILIRYHLVGLREIKE
jgi:beta-N-acetylglucosaminidase